MAQDAFDKLAAYSAATIHEAIGKQGALPAAIKPIAPTMKVFGPAYTVSSMPGDNLLMHRALADASPGAVMVVSVSGFYECGYWGEIMTVAAQARGLAGLVIDGCVRDADEIEELGFPVFCRGLSIKGTTKHGTGTLNQPLHLGDTRIEPGDIIVGDRDGLVAVPAAKVEDAVARSQARIEKEQRTMQALREGKTTLEIYGWQ